MKIKTADELSSRLRDDLSWRVKELSVIDSMVRRTEAAKQQAILRGAIASVYAHWEGFVKLASDAYLDFVRTRNLSISELQVNFVGLVIRGRVRTAVLAGDAAQYGEFVGWLLREWQSRAHLPSSEKLSTRSNLSSAVFRDIVSTLGLHYRQEYFLAEKGVIEPLLSDRNALAHGEWQSVKQEAFDQYRMWIERLMRLFCEDIEDAAFTQRYRRATPQLA